MKDKDSKKIKITEISTYNVENRRCSGIKRCSKQKELELFLKLHIANHRPG